MGFEPSNHRGKPGQGHNLSCCVVAPDWNVRFVHFIPGLLGGDYSRDLSPQFAANLFETTKVLAAWSFRRMVDFSEMISLAQALAMFPTAAAR